MWQYYNDTLKEGGTPNKQTDFCWYADSYKGSDVTGDGSHDNPYQSIQKVFDEMSSAADGGSTNTADLLLAGVFLEGDFINRPLFLGIIADGDVTIDGTSSNIGCSLGVYTNNFNIDVTAGHALRSYGYLTIQNYISIISKGCQYNQVPDPTDTYGSYRTTFKNTPTVGVLSYQLHSENVVKECVYENISLNAYFSGLYLVVARTSIYERVNFINVAGFYMWNQFTSSQWRDSYWDSACTQIEFRTLLSTNQRVDNCHFTGNVASYIRINNVYYNNSTLAKVTNALFNDNGRLYTDDPQFNALTSDDYTLQEASPNATAGYTGGQIGAFGVARGGQNVDNANWNNVGAPMTNITITGVGSAAVATLTAAGVGTLETFAGVPISPLEDRYLGRIVLPSLFNDYLNGETVDTTKSADELASPTRYTLQVKVSVDDITYSTNWIEVPYSCLPLVDAVGVGNGSDAFDSGTSTRITARYIKYKITLRSDEVTTPIIP